MQNNITMKNIHTFRAFQVVERWLLAGCYGLPILITTLLLTLGTGQMWAYWHVPGTHVSTGWALADNNASCMNSSNTVTFYNVSAGTYQFKLVKGDTWGNGNYSNLSSDYITSVTKNGAGDNDQIVIKKACDLTFTITNQDYWNCNVSATDPTFYIRYKWNNGSTTWSGALTSNGDNTYSCTGQYGINGTYYHTRLSSTQTDGGTSGTATVINSPSLGDLCVFTFRPSNNSLTITRCNKVTKTNYIYFYNADDILPNIHKYFVIGHDKPTAYSKVIDGYYSTNIPHTKLAYWRNTTDTWNDATYYAFCSPSSEWTNGDWGSSNLSNAGHYTAAFTNKQDLASGKYYMAVPFSGAGNGGSFSMEQQDSYTAFNKSQYVTRIVLNNEATNFANSNDNSVGSVSITGWYLYTAGGCSSNTAEVGSNESNHVSAAYSGDVTYTAVPGSGYTFAGWYSTKPTTLGTGTLLSTDLEYTREAPYGTSNVYAAFIQETSHDVTISEYCTTTSSTISSDTRAIGEVTYVAITAPEIFGYTFRHWMLGTGMILQDGDEQTNATIHVKTKASGNYTLRAVYTENLTSAYRLRGGWTNGWGTTGEVVMARKTGHSADRWVYCTKTFTGSTTKVAIKLYDSNGDVWYGKNSTNITKTLGSLEKSTSDLSSSGDNMYFEHLVAGTYEFAYDTVNHILKITWPDINQIQITNGDASSPTPAGYYNFDGVSGTVYSKTFTFSKNKRYSAKILYHSDFYAFNTTSDMTIDNHTSWRLYDTANGANICNVYSPVAGSYTYQFNSNDGGLTKLTVTYPTAYTITFGVGDLDGSNSAISATASPTFASGDYVLASTAVTFNKGTTKDGYTWKGWYSNPDGTGTLHSSVDGNWTSATSTRTGNISVYACYNYATYTVTLQNSGETGYGSGSASRNVTATYNIAMPAVAAGNLPTAANGYAFMGYYDDHDGAGTKYYNADGSSAHVWDKTSPATLYAYFQKAQITGISFSPSATVAPSTTITATATISPTPTGTTIVCWEVLHNNDNPLETQPTFSPESGASVSFSVPETSGTYKIKATLRTGDDCEDGTELSSQMVLFQVAGDHNVTVQYRDEDGVTIQASTTVTGKPLEWSSAITAPDIFGYTFNHWEAIDGVTISTDGSTPIVSSTTTTATIYIKANYDGKLRAVYTKKSIIYFKNTLGWSDVYVNIMSNSKWGAYNGAGNNMNYYSRNNQMSLVPGTADIYYLEYSGSTSAYMSFTSQSQDGYDYFWAGDADPVKVVYPTRPNDDGSEQTAYGYNAGTPMFVPIAGQEAYDKNVQNDGRAKYYNKGHWRKYDPIQGETGYTLKIYDKTAADGRNLLKSIKFTDSDVAGQLFKAVVGLDAAGGYGVKFERDNSMLYTNTSGHLRRSGDVVVTESNPENYQAIWIKATAAGDYTFAITINGDGKLCLQAEFPVSVGDYRVVYTDNDTWTKAHTAESWIHPSRIIPAEADAVDTISFFVSKGHAPEFKIQQATAINEGTGAVTWGTDVTSWTSCNDVDASGVYNFIFAQNSSSEISFTKKEPYTGEMYIRTALAGSTQWDNYLTADHMMTYSQYSEENSDYTHYWMVYTDGDVDVKFVVANTYSPCISDTLVQSNYRGTDAANASGHLTPRANIRFMWHKGTNATARAYLSPAQSDGSKFLVLRGTDDDNIRSESGGVLSGDSEANPGNNHGGGNHCIQFVDDENWIYETTVQCLPSSYVKLYALFNGSYFYYKGDTGENFNDSDDDSDGIPNAIQLITGSGSHLKIRVIYDFKTDRLVSAYLPSGEISTEMDINADVMFIREHQGDIDQVVFKDKGSGMGVITDIKTAYGVMRFNKWTLNNKSQVNTGTIDDPEHLPLASPLSRYERDLFYISFPFDVNLNEVFGFGTYGTHWIIEEYDGAGRAQKGFWQDSPTFWKYITNRNGVVLHKNVGYLLALDLDELTEESEVWNHGVEKAELFFPSSGTMDDITSGSVTATLPEHTCTIVRNGSDRRIADSHWNIMGVPTYVNTNNISFANTTWTTGSKDPEAGILGPKFLYTWNPDDNSLTATTAKGFMYHAMHAYTVQYYGDVTWESSVSVTPSPIVSRERQAPTEYEWCLELQQNDQMTDRTYIRMSNEEEVTTGFEFGYDMSKNPNKNRANIYSFIGTEMVAGNSMPIQTEQTTIVPLGLNIKTAGDYTFAMPDGTNRVGVTLVDTEANIRTSLSALDYTVNLSAGQYDSRFVLEISPVQEVITDIPSTGDGMNGTSRKVLIDGILYIVRDGKIYDARGARTE